MRTSAPLFGAALLLAALPLAAQSSLTPPLRTHADSTPFAPLPNVRAVSAGLNPAAELIDKRRRLTLDAATVVALRGLDSTFSARYADGLAHYDSLRREVLLHHGRLKCATTPSFAELESARARTNVIRHVITELLALSRSDVGEVLATIPEGKRSVAEGILEEQGDDLARALRQATPEGIARATGAPCD